MVYYTIKDVSRRKYDSLENAKEACEKLDDTKFVIEKHEITEIKFKCDKNVHNETLVKNLIGRIVNLLHTAEYSKTYDDIDFAWDFEDMCDYAFKCGKLPKNERYKHTPEDYQIMYGVYADYIQSLIEKYPIEDIKINMLKTNYRACNAIQIYFEDTYKYLTSGFTKTLYCGTEYDLFPTSFCIQLRGTSKEKSIVFKNDMGCYGRNVSDIGTEKINLTDKETQKYIDDVFNYFNK